MVLLVAGERSLSVRVTMGWCSGSLRQGTGRETCHYAVVVLRWQTTKVLV